MKPLDVEGVTADNADQRFVTKDGSPHGMVEATRILLDIFNAAVPEILPELEQLGMTQNTGPFSLYFNTEFVLKKINVKEYPFNFIAIHGINRFVQKGPKSRKGIGVETDQGLLDQIKDKVQTFANERDFRVYTSIPANVKNSILLEDALNDQFTIVYKNFANDPEEPGELGAGEGSTKPLKAWLADVHDNPVNKKVNISQKMRNIYPKMSRVQTPYAKNIYLEVLKGTAVSDIAEGPEDVESVVDAVVVMHSTRILGNAVLDALESDEFGSAREQEGVVVKDPEICGGTPFKFTGDFIVGGLLGSAFNEAKFKKGQLLESFFPEPFNMTEDEEVEPRYIVLIPGGFKPPTVGHHEMIEYYDKKPDIRKVFVITGTKAREGVTLEQSKEIFKVYGGFSEKVEFIPSDDPTPLRTCYELLKNENFVNQFPNASFSIGASDKADDAKRIEQFVSYFAKNDKLTNANIVFYPPSPAVEVAGGPASASRMRKAFAEEDWELFKQLLPDDNFYDDVVQILNFQGGGKVNENFLLAIPQSFLVEKKLTQAEKEKREQVAKAIAKDNPNMPMDKKMATATNIAKRVAEELITEQELTTVQEQDLREKIKIALSNVLAFVPGFEIETKANIVAAIVPTVFDQIVKNIKLNKGRQEVPEEEAEEITALAEMSSMAAGAVAGHSGGKDPWLMGEEDEQENRVA